MTGLLELLFLAARLYQFVILIRCVFSFIHPSPFNPLVRFVYRITDPLLDAVRNAFPFLAQGGIDFSPIVILFLIQITTQYIAGLVY